MSLSRSRCWTRGEARRAGVEESGCCRSSPPPRAPRLLGNQESCSGRVELRERGPAPPLAPPPDSGPWARLQARHGTAGSSKQPPGPARAGLWPGAGSGRQVAPAGPGYRSPTYDPILPTASSSGLRRAPSSTPRVHRTQRHFPETQLAG